MNELIPSLSSIAARLRLKQLRLLIALDDRGSLHRSEEHTSELQSRLQLVCRLLLEKKATDFRNCGM